MTLVAVRDRTETGASADLAAARGRQGAHVAEMQRRRLLLACVEVLASRGLAEANVGRICARAGVSRRTFYDLFDDREGCLLAAFDDLLEQIAARVAPAFAAAGCWRERIRAALTVLLELFDEQPAVARVCLVETLKAGPALLERRRAVLAALAAIIDEGRSESRSASGPAPLTAESVVGGAIAVVHARVSEQRDRSALVGLVNPLMSMIVTPYLGAAAARRELQLAAPVPAPAPMQSPASVGDPFEGLPMRITFRTARVLGAIAAEPGANNREIADGAGIGDQGQMSKLLKRLEAYGLIENRGLGQARGEPNAWRLSARGEAVRRAIEKPSP